MSSENKDTPASADRLVPRPVLKLKPRQDFWINWRAGGSRPKKRHASLDDALAERTRLMQLHPGDRFETFQCTFISPQKSGVTHLAELEVRARPDIAAAIHSIIVARHGSGPVRIGSDGSRLYLFKRVWGMPLASADFLRGATGANGFAVLGTTVRIGIARTGAIVVSGTDDAGKPYRWENGDPLTVARDDLPALEGNLAAWILRAVENLLASGNFSEEPQAPKRTRRTA